MTSITIKAFRGKVPRMGERLLQGNFATEALNCKITSGRLDPIKGPALVHTSLAASIATMYRYRNAGVDYWLVWGKSVDVVRSPTAQDAFNRLYYTGDGAPRMTTFSDAISGVGPYPVAWYTLGVYIPTVAPALVVSGGSGTTETRAYVYTFVTQYGEESAPGPAVVVSGFQNGTWSLSGMETPPPNAGTVSGAASLGGGVVRVTLDTNRGLAPYEQITFAAVGGMTDLNGTVTIKALNGANEVDVLLNTAQAYTAGGTWTRTAPHNTAGMKRRIYRTVGTNTDYKRVAEIAATTTSYDDTVAATALGTNLPTLNSYTPPKNGHSIVALANGAAAMLAGNELCISEQYKLHSWPLANRYAFMGTGVALCAAGNSVIVLTDSFPVVATATVPEAASLAKMEDTYAPCVAKAGVVDIGGGCVSPSHDGLWELRPGAARKLTQELYTQDEWGTLLPTSFKAAVFDGRYYAMHDAVAGQTAKMLVLELAAPDSVIEVDERVDGLYANPLDGELYLAKGSKIYQWDADDSNRYLSFWQSAEFQIGRPVNFACAQVHARYSEIVPLDTSVVDANTALLASADNIEGAAGASVTGMYPIGASNLLDAPLESANRVQFSLLRDGEIIFTRAVNSSTAFRLPAGFKSEVYTVQISSSIRLYSVAVAQGMSELEVASG